MSNYRPLPHFLTISRSKLDGFGLFARQDLPANLCIGVTHYLPSSAALNHHGLVIRTPLGGFINHSEEPNCDKLLHGAPSEFPNFYGCYKIWTTRFIEAGEEILLKYTFYDV